MINSSITGNKSKYLQVSSAWFAVILHGTPQTPDYRLSMRHLSFALSAFLILFLLKQAKSSGVTLFSVVISDPFLSIPVARVSSRKPSKQLFFYSEFTMPRNKWDGEHIRKSWLQGSRPASENTRLWPWHLASITGKLFDLYPIL
jgi:hypothetical protein